MLPASDERAGQGSGLDCTPSTPRRGRSAPAASAADHDLGGSSTASRSKTTTSPGFDTPPRRLQATGRKRSRDPAESAPVQRRLFSPFPELNHQQLAAAHSPIGEPSLIVAGVSRSLLAVSYAFLTCALCSYLSAVPCRALWPCRCWIWQDYRPGEAGAVPCATGN